MARAFLRSVFCSSCLFLSISIASLSSLLKHLERVRVEREARRGDAPLECATFFNWSPKHRRTKPVDRVVFDTEAATDNELGVVAVVDTLDASKTPAFTTSQRSRGTSTSLGYPGGSGRGVRGDLSLSSSPLAQDSVHRGLKNTMSFSVEGAGMCSERHEGLAVSGDEVELVVALALLASSWSDSLPPSLCHVNVVEATEHERSDGDTLR